METREKTAYVALFFFREPFVGQQSEFFSYLQFSQASPEKSIPPPITTCKASLPSSQAHGRASLNSRPCMSLAHFCIWPFVQFALLRAPTTISLVPFIHSELETPFLPCAFVFL